MGGCSNGLVPQPDRRTLQTTPAEYYIYLNRTDADIASLTNGKTSDVINTYRLWLRHELFRGRLDHAQFEYSERDVTRVVGSAADRAAG